MIPYHPFPEHTIASRSQPTSLAVLPTSPLLLHIRIGQICRPQNTAFDFLLSQLSGCALLRSGRTVLFPPRA
ncbi:hypothetical protein AFLA_000969 [Aspergillus flavus NRRL3357]|nr:hypothetical protein AFLA_000969 [Aspergillus flavus NRRL3357]